MTPKIAIVKNKTSVSWRINTKELEQVPEEARRRGLGSIPAFINWLLAEYFSGRTIRK